MAAPKRNLDQFLQLQDAGRWKRMHEDRQVLGGILNSAVDEELAEWRKQAAGAYQTYLNENPEESAYQDATGITLARERKRAEIDRKLMEDQIQGLAGVRDLRSMLETYATKGYTPTEADLKQAESVFSPRQLALEEAFKQQRIGNQQLAARLGRAANDPILAAKLAQEQTRQAGMLSAEKASYAAELPLQRLGFLQQRAGLEAEQLGAVQGRQFQLSSLAQQAQLAREQMDVQRQQLEFQRYQYEDSKPGWFAQALNVAGGLAGGVGAGMSGYGAILGAMNKTGNSSSSTNYNIPFYLRK